MCLYSDGKRRIAENDIRVWKKVRVPVSGDSWRGLFEYNDKVFPFGKVCVEEGGEPEDGCMVFGGFFHSFRQKTDASFIRVGKFAVSSEKNAVVECTIPKGSVYYAGRCGDGFASDKIIVHKPKKR